jgi:hypothetical protein
MRTIQDFNGDHSIVGLTSNELVEILKGVERGTFGYFEIHTNVRMNKTGNPYHDQITKITKGNVYIGGDYKKRVEKKNEIEDFTPEKCTVGQKIEDSPVQYNERLDRHYLQYEWFEEVRPKSEFIFEGNPIEKQIFQDFMRSYSPNKYQVNVQSVMISNIKEIHLNHVHYRVENEVLV